MFSRRHEDNLAKVVNVHSLTFKPTQMKINGIFLSFWKPFCQNFLPSYVSTTVIITVSCTIVKFKECRILASIIFNIFRHFLLFSSPQCKYVESVWHVTDLPHKTPTFPKPCFGTSSEWRWNLKKNIVRSN